MSFDFGSLAGIGVSAATGNFIGAAVQGVGLGLSIFGGLGQSSAAAGQAAISQQESQVSSDEATQEQAISLQKQQAMELDARRQSMENLRKTQKFQATALSNATNEGAQFGSGLQGGLAGVRAQGTLNQENINDSLEIGRNIAGYNNSITLDKYKMFGLQSQSAALGGTAATDAGFASLGGSIMKAGPFIGQISQGFNPGGKASGQQP